jgi:hypothetical protein
MMGYLPMAIAAGGVLDESRGRLRRFATRVLHVSLAISAVAAAFGAMALAAPNVLGRSSLVRLSADPTNETRGWDRVRQAIAVETAALGPDTVVAGAHNVLCGHLLSAIDDSPRVYCPSVRRTEFDFIGRRSPPPRANVIFVGSDRYVDDPETALPDHVCQPAREVPVESGGRVVARYELLRCIPRSEARP